jgi:RimJ/RimL family protein N-acetyltransferase
LAWKKALGQGSRNSRLKKLLQEITHLPLFARAAKDNIRSIRVLQKCDFKIIGENKDFAQGRGEETGIYFPFRWRNPIIKIPNQVAHL